MRRPRPLPQGELIMAQQAEMADLALPRLRGPSARMPWLVMGCTLGFGLGLASLCTGPTTVGLGDLVALLQGRGEARAELVIRHLRLPRTLLAIGVGGALGLSGALLQGLFRNPLADPGLIGVSTGAAVGAAAMVVVGGLSALSLPTAGGACVFGLLATAGVWWLAREGQQVSVERLLLAGIAINALCGALLGAAFHFAEDAALRNLSAWTLGALGHAHLEAALALLAVLAAALLTLPWFAPRLDALLLGEENAQALGISLRKLQLAAVVLSALLVAFAVSLSGLIGFIGLVAPHLLRLLGRPLHRWVLPGSVLVGALLLLTADVLARTLIPPQELPVGVLSALLGGPFFLCLMRRSRRRVG